MTGRIIALQFSQEANGSCDFVIMALLSCSLLPAQTLLIHVSTKPAALCGLTSPASTSIMA